MATIFLTNAPYTLQERYGKLAAVGATLPCLGLLTLASSLREAGHRVCLEDASATGLNEEALLARARRCHPDIIGLTAVTPSISRTNALAIRMKESFPSTPIILGGPHVTAIPEGTLKACSAFDYAVIGEGEQTIVELVEALAAGRTCPDVEGTLSRNNDSLYFCGPREPIRDLDTVPFPAWDLLQGFPNGYRPAIFKYKNLPSTHVVSARGCPGKWMFCDTSVFGRQVRFHSPEYVLGLVEYLTNSFGMREIIFEDDQFLLRTDRVAGICEGLIKAKLPISWSCSGRVNAVKDPGLLRLMKRSGCWLINYGIESGNQAILDAAQKGITLEQIEKAVSMTHRAGIQSKGYFILGLPGETEQTIRNTVRFAKALPLDDISVFMLTPFPGSHMYKIAGDHGTLNCEFDRMNILDVVYTPKGLSKHQLTHYQHRFMKAFYVRPRILGSYLDRLAQSPANIADMAKAAFGFFRHVFE